MVHEVIFSNARRCEHFLFGGGRAVVGQSFDYSARRDHRIRRRHCFFGWIASEPIRDLIEATAVTVAPETIR